ncbi:MAG: benzoate-CoA ligase family protein [Candidatus Binatia bacterium]
MRIAVVGAGPAGLLFSLLMKRQRPRDEIVVIEQNARDATFGFGVVFSRGALEFLSRDEPTMHATLAAAMESWPLQRIVHRDERVDIDGNGFSAIARIALLQILQRHCEALGVRIEFERAFESLAPLAGFDLVVGADGVHSMVRRQLAHAFQPHVEWLTNKFAWYGTAQPFECLTLTFRTSEHGAFVAHHYRYSPTMSTFIVECDAATWYRAELDRASETESRAYCERLFAPDLQNHPLVSNKSVWRNFPLVQNACWSAGNAVLIGDALRTGHFSIGSGTRLAFDDAIFLARAFETAGADVPGALETFERARRPIVEKLVAAANQSSYWYERMSDKMRLDPWEIAYDYMRRSGRMTDERLREEAPRFMGLVDAKRAAGPRRALGPISDPVPRDAPGAAEIGFAIVGRYNASAILFDNLGNGRGAKTAIVCGERHVRYGELCDAAARAGNGLRRLGLARGGRVVLLLDDRPEYAAAIFGAIRAGFVPVLVNTLSPAELVGYFLQDSGAEAAIVDARFLALLEHDGARASRLRHVVVVGGPGANLGPPVTVQRWEPWLADQTTRLECADTDRDEMAFWMYSSGSTGRPKGVVHLQHDPAYTYQSYGRGVLGIVEHDVVFSPPKIFFAYGFGNSLTFPFSVGATTVLLSGRPDPETVLTTIERDRPTMLFGLPTLYNALVAHPGSEGRDLSSLRLCLSAAEPLSAELFHEWRRRYGLAIVEGLGSTEVLHIYLSNGAERQTLGASGTRVPGYELRLTDSEGRPVAKGEPGILWVRGDSQAPCYWNRPDKTAETMRDGWIYTGDRFRENEQGSYFFEGRADDLVKVSGQWVYPLEVERCLAEHPAIRECAVLAVEDANRLTTLTAFVALRPGQRADAAMTRDLQDFVKRKLLPYKYPRNVQYLESLPKTGTDKIDRQRLREQRSSR